jgi:hypothetical protein
MKAAGTSQTSLRYSQDPLGTQKTHFEKHWNKWYEVGQKASFYPCPDLAQIVLHPETGSFGKEEARVSRRQVEFEETALYSHYPTCLPHASGTYPANDRLEHPRNIVLLQAEQVRGLTVHSEAVGVVVVLHWTDKASVSRHHIGQLRRKDREADMETS